jgi:serine phosphatase RsbU (regulator of sigma subunit)
MARPAFILTWTACVRSIRSVPSAVAARSEHGSLTTCAVVLFLLFVLSTDLFAQGQAKIDSLERVLASSMHDDTLRARTLVRLAEEYAETEQYTEALDRSAQVFALAKRTAKASRSRIVIRKAVASAHLIAGGVLMHQGDNHGALEHYFDCARIWETLGTPANRAAVYMNIATIYEIEGNSLKSFEYYQKSLDATLASGNKLNIAFIYLNLGTYYSHQNDYAKALEHCSKGIEYLKEVGNRPMLARAYGNVGHLYRRQRSYDMALEYAQDSYAIIEDLRDTSGLNYVCNTLGDIFLEMSTGGTATNADGSEAVLHPSLLDSAEHYFERSMALGHVLGSDRFLPHNLSGLGDVARLRDRTEKARQYYEKAMVLAERDHIDDTFIDIWESLSAVHERQGDFRDALRYHKLFTTAKDSVFDKDKQKELGRLEAKSEYDREALRATKERENEDALHQAELEKRALERNSLIGGLAALLLLIAVGFRNYQNKRRAYEEVQQQKTLLEARNKEIMDSIRYAKHIQEAVLPPDAAFRNALPESFVLFRPKDIVSGDFYWFDRKGDRTMLAVIDCTGHGVPGALMTIMASNGLSKAVSESVSASPAEILDRLNWFVNESMRRTYEKNFVRDGMDISLCVLDMAEQRLRFAGANHPLVMIRDNEITEIKGDKHPVGIFVGEALKPFTEHELQLQRNDSLYLFTDGFTDQFGGEQGKKFKTSRLKELLLSVQKGTMLEQRRWISEAIFQWKGDLEQVDDMCMVGLRMNDANTPS